MKFQIKLGLSFMVISAINSFAFEVNTHQAITRCAISTECNKAGAVNLHKFAEDTFFDKKTYSEEIFEKYGKKYLNYATTGEGLDSWRIGFKSDNPYYLNLVEVGVILEDSVYPHRVSNNLVNGGEGRFNNHFYSAQFTLNESECTEKINLEVSSPAQNIASSLGLPILASDRLSEHALCNGATSRTDNITWALKRSMTLADNRTNDYGLDDAFNYYRKSFEGNADERRKNQAKLFVSLGFMIHMIQDLHSPAHVRDGSHAGGDYLEIYGRYNGGFNLVNGAINKTNNNPKIWNAVQSIDMKKLMLIDNKYQSYQDFFTHEANWISKNFMSEAHDIDFTEKFSDINNITGNGLELDEDEIDEKFSTIFDKYNLHLTKEEVDENAISGAETHPFGDKKWFYLTTKGSIESANEKGEILNTANTVAIRYKGYFGFENETMSMVTNGTDNGSYANYNKTALSNTAINVMPRAVVSSEAFINYFFRGRMKATLAENEENITIENISDPQWVSSADLCIFKKGMTVDISYIDDQNISRPLLSTTLSKDVVIGEEYAIEGIKTKLDNLTYPMGDKKQIAVLLDGQLGEKRGLDSYGINARGLVVAYASARVANADILFSFDKSGSMGSDIERAKSSAKSVLDDIVGVDNNSTYMQIEAFNSGASVLLVYENNVTKAKNTISTIYSGGGTALYDAIKLAGNNAVAHKKANNIPKSIVILYTDGQENSSSATKQQAIDAISNANASEIDEVFLIHVGNGGGASELNSIALKAGRKYLKVDNASALKDAISKILRGQ